MSRPKTYNELYINTRRLFRDKGIEAFSLEARLITAFAAGKDTLCFLRDLCLYSSPEVEEKLSDLIKRRLSGEPVAYITGSWEFYGLPLIISRDVLIPRVDTEVLADAAIEYMRGGIPDARVLDLCSGSGCIGCAIASEMPLARIVSADVSPAAVKICRENISLNGLEDRMSCVEADAFSPPDPDLGSFDLIVSNPPYIPSSDIPLLDASVRLYEPHLALDGGDDGLHLYRAIIQNWKSALREGGMIMFEAGIGQTDSIKTIMRLGNITPLNVITDTGGIRRVVTGLAP